MAPRTQHFPVRAVSAVIDFNCPDHPHLGPPSTPVCPSALEHCLSPGLQPFLVLWCICYQPFPELRIVWIFWIELRPGLLPCFCLMIC